MPDDGVMLLHTHRRTQPRRGTANAKLQITMSRLRFVKFILDEIFPAADYRWSRRSRNSATHAGFQVTRGSELASALRPNAGHLGDESRIQKGSRRFRSPRSRSTTDTCSYLTGCADYSTRASPTSANSPAKSFCLARLRILRYTSIRDTGNAAIASTIRGGGQSQMAESRSGAQEDAAAVRGHSSALRHLQRFLRAVPGSDADLQQRVLRARGHDARRSPDRQDRPGARQARACNQG